MLTSTELNSDNDEVNLQLDKAREFTEMGMKCSLAKARTDGRLEARAQMALRMMRKNMDFSIIKEISGLWLDEIELIRRENLYNKSKEIMSDLNSLDPSLKDAYERLKWLSSDEGVLSLYEAQANSRIEYNSLIAEAETRGEAKVKA